MLSIIRWEWLTHLDLGQGHKPKSEHLGLNCVMNCVILLQIHITYVNGSSVVVSWATGNGTVVNGPMSAANVTNTYGALSTNNVTTDTTNAYPVYYGTSATMLNMSVAGTETTYSQIYTGKLAQALQTCHMPMYVIRLFALSHIQEKSKVKQHKQQKLHGADVDESQCRLWSVSMSGISGMTDVYKTYLFKKLPSVILTASFLKLITHLH